MARSSSRTESGDSGQRNKVLLIVSVVILVVAGGWFYMSQPKDLDQQMRDQVQAKVAEHSQTPASTDGDGSVATPPDEVTADGSKSDSGEPAEQPAEETPNAPKKPKKARTGAVF